MDKSRQQFLLILKISCVLLFLGRGWQYLFWDAPLRTLLWNESLLSPIIESFTSMSWKEYVTSLKADAIINIITRIFGVFYLLMAGMSIYLSPTRIKLAKSLLVATGVLFGFTFLYFMEKSFYLGMLIEHATQVGLPWAFYVALTQDNFFTKYFNHFKAMVAMTFVGHGMFAVGIHPIPGQFIDMVITVFGVTEDAAYDFLALAGALDFAAALFIFIPATQLYALGFNIFWGITTAFARFVSHVDFDLLGFTSHQWVLETLYRLPHGLFPLALFLYVKSKKKL
jgi:hypothetical protein